MVIVYIDQMITKVMYKAIFFLISIAILSFPAIGQDVSVESSTVKPKNVILMIGDGMGLSKVSSPYYFGEEEPSFSRFRYIGLSRTSSGSDPITQSPAAATAMSPGHKTYNMAVGVDMDTVVQENLVEIFSKQGMMTGVIATSSVTDATPAGFYAHQPNRYMQHEIALDLLKSDIDYFAGGGIKYFLDTT